MKNNWRILVVVIVAMIATTCIFGCTKISPSEDFLDSYDEAVDIINNKLPHEVILYGEDIYFRETFQYRRVDNITNDLLNYDKRRYRRQIIIVNELNSAAVLTDEHCKVIKDGLYNNSLDFYYFGANQAHIQMFIDYAIISSFPPNEDLSICVALTERTQVRWNGVWTKRDAQITANIEEEPGYGILRQIAHCIKTNY
ncbi:MAG: hypothetical protein FWC25_01830 [Dehalococcoidia bacterium]|nr:hypothetical protein [Dehalococcoidia bacterium]